MIRQILTVAFCLLAFVSIGLFMSISKANMNASFVYAQY
jgi:hypothetical protein